MDASPTRRIVILGKTGAGKSSLGNTLLGENIFQMSHSPLSETSICQAESKLINRRFITLIDTPGFFDMSRSEEDMKSKILPCIVECAPGPHAFILVLKVERFTDHEKAIIQSVLQYLSEEVLRYATILFTHGDQLPEEMKIEEFVSQSECLVELVQKCGGRCHVIDNKYWKNKPKNEYRSNRFQVEQLLKTIDNIVKANKGGYYTNELLQAVEAEIQNEEERIRQASGTLSPEEAREKAKTVIHKNDVAKFARIAGKGLLIVAMLGGSHTAGLALLAIKGVGAIKQAVGKRKRAKFTVSKKETAKGETARTAAGKAPTASTPKEGAPTKEAAAEKGATRARTETDVFSKLAKFFRPTNADTKEEISPSITDEAATLEEEEEEEVEEEEVEEEGVVEEEEEAVEDKTEELLEGEPIKEGETTDVLQTTEADVAEGEEEGETSEDAAEGEALGGAVPAEGEVTAALTAAAEEEIDGVLLSAAEEAASEAAGAADSIAAAVEGVAELSIEGVETEAVEGAAEVIAEAMEGVSQAMDVVAQVAESCCIQ